MPKLMSNEELIQKNILPLRDEVKPWILKCGISEKAFDRRFSNLEKKTPRELRLFLTWLLKLRGNKMEAERIWKQLPPSVWDMYEKCGEEELREIELLNDAKQNIKETWHSRK